MVSQQTARVAEKLLQVYTKNHGTKGNKSVTADVSEKIKEKFTTLKEMFRFKEGMAAEEKL